MKTLFLQKNYLDDARCYKMIEGCYEILQEVTMVLRVVIEMLQDVIMMLQDVTRGYNHDTRCCTLLFLGNAM